MMTRRALLAMPLAAVAAPVVAAEAETPITAATLQPGWASALLICPKCGAESANVWPIELTALKCGHCGKVSTLAVEFGRPYHNPSGLWPPTIMAKILEEVRDVRE